MNRLFTSAALFYGLPDSGGVPLGWFEAVSAFLAGKGLPVQIFVANARGFNFERHYNLVKYGPKLVRALREGMVEDLFLYSVPSRYEVVEEDCIAEAGLAYQSGNFFLGIDRIVNYSPSIILETALNLAGNLPEIKYGIAYDRLLSKGPFEYAVGCGTNPDPFDQERERLGEWGRELCGQSRHLAGMFRGAYPASILSEEHVKALVRENIFREQSEQGYAGLGRLQPIKEGYWLWELKDAEIDQADDALENSGLIIHN
jgi:hypothetical protein